MQMNGISGQVQQGARLPEMAPEASDKRAKPQSRAAVTGLSEGTWQAPASPKTSVEMLPRPRRYGAGF